MRSDFKATKLLSHNVSINKVTSSNLRLDAKHFVLFRGNDVLPSHINTKSLVECCNNIFEVPIFVHTYVEEANGIPFYTSSSLFESNLRPAHYLSHNTKALEKYRIERGQILMARSGSGGLIGCVTFATERLENTTASDHVIRICPNKDSINPGYLYVYLSSKSGQKEMLKHASGAAIPAIRPEALYSIQVPIFSTGIQNKLGNMIQQAFKYRDEAIDKLNEANNKILAINMLPDLGVKSESETMEYFQTKASELLGESLKLSNVRLDAHFYNPAARQAVTNITKCKSDIKLIKDVANVFMGPRFKRNYVDSAHGVPFLSGKNIIQIRPTDLKYLSNMQMADMQELIIKRGWSLVTCSGTIGRTCFVWHNYEEYAASQHILRVKPNEEEIDPAYLNAFIASRYGYEQILRFRHGSVIDEITDKQIEQVLVPCPSRKEQEVIGDMVRKAYELRAEAIRLEDEAQEILKNELKALPEGR